MVTRLRPEFWVWRYGVGPIYGEPGVLPPTPWRPTRLAGTRLRLDVDRAADINGLAERHLQEPPR